MYFDGFNNKHGLLLFWFNDKNKRKRKSRFIKIFLFLKLNNNI